jgi:DNA repair exonuclease SbcCD ATPase subunit
MHITQLTLRNFGPFKGRHTVDLEPEVYAVMAQHQDDPDRSNWLGKSTFLAAIRFALYGKFSKDMWPTEDAWITEGEKEGGVILVLSTGAVVTRSRELGKATQLTWDPAPNADLPSNIAKQASAQELIDLALGMDHEGFLTGPYIQQKQIARLVTALPTERTAIFNGWLELGPLQEAAAWQQSRLTELLKEDANLARQAADVTADDEFPVEQLEKELATVDIELAAAKRSRAMLDDAWDKRTEYMGHVKSAAEFDQIRTEGRAMKAEVDAWDFDPSDAHQKRDDARSLFQDAKGTWSDLNEICNHGFDGQCPIIGSTCPVKEDINDQVQEMERDLPVAEIAVDGAQQDLYNAEEKARLADSKVRGHRDDEVKLVELRKRGKRLQLSATYIKEHDEPPPPREERQRLQGIHDELIRQRAAIDQKIKNQEGAADKTAKIVARRLELVDAIRTSREAVTVLGRGGVQREIAEESMGIIEARANRLLTDAGIQLSIEIRWSREGSGLAKNCDMCGAPYPKGRGVKECDTCGAERGPHMVEKTYFAISNRSGAADDIAGLSFQLAAASWQRECKQMQWSTVLIDEPFGACDRANARAMGVHLHSMIRLDHGFEQGFVVAHDARVMEAMPARVVVTSDGKHARLEIV